MYLNISVLGLLWVESSLTLGHSLEDFLKRLVTALEIYVDDAKGRQARLELQSGEESKMELKRTSQRTIALEGILGKPPVSVNVKVLK